MKKYIVLFISMICLLSMEANAQKERKFIRSGNDLFEGDKFENSEVEYRKALDKKVNSYEAGFNLGDALYKQKKYDEALKQFQALALTEKDNQKLGHLYHNMGNTLLENKKIDESIEAYKQSLRYFPDSKETKYNLEYARQMKKKQEEQEKKDQQNKDQNKDQDKKDQDKKDQDKKDQDKKDQDKKDQDKKKDQKDKDKQDQKDKQGDQDKKKQDQQQQNKISKQDAQRLLEALENDEKKVQEKVQKAKAKAQKAKKTKIKKDW